MISFDTISTNRYAPAGSDAVNLYSNGLDGCPWLTIAQLAIAVSMRSAAAYEAQSVLKMNRMAGGSDKLSKSADYLEQIADGSGDWAEIKAYMQNTLQISAELPDNLGTYNKRMQAVSALKAKMDALAQTQQEAMIDLQTLVNRRDVAFSTSSNIVRTLGTSMAGNAVNFN
ncbi:MAG: hypothetical protein J6T51_02920 [Kiritimatiellae bacterium]|nr:hypothetical protein [Kiritimatiellia bacterium]